MQENLPRSAASHPDVIYIHEHALQSFRSEQPKDNSAQNLNSREPLDAQIEQIRLSQSSSSVSEEGAQSLDDSDHGDMMRPLLVPYALNSDRSVQESEPDGETNLLPLLAQLGQNFEAT